jgi:uncharacterized protein (TIGR02147 family)
MESARPHVIEYLDFRAYLLDFCTHQKRANSSFSLRAFSARIAPTLADASLISAVLKGRRQLSAALRPKVAKALGLKGSESGYFDLLVQFNQSKSMEEKNNLFLDLAKFRNSRAKIVGESQYKYYSKWHHAVVWSYIGMQKKRVEPVRIAKEVYPALTLSQVEESIKLLLELKLVKKTANGYAVTENHITTEKEFRGLVARRFNQELIGLSLEAVDRVPAPLRQYNTMIASVSEEGFKSIRERMVSFNEELKDLVDKDKQTDRVYIVCMQLWPATKQILDTSSRIPLS